MSATDIFNDYFSLAKKTDYIFNRYKEYQSNYGIHHYDAEMKLFYIRSSFVYSKLINLVIAQQVWKYQVNNISIKPTLTHELVSHIKQNSFHFKRVTDFLNNCREEIISILSLSKQLDELGNELSHLDRDLNKAGNYLAKAENFIHDKSSYHYKKPA